MTQGNEVSANVGIDLGRILITFPLVLDTCSDRYLIDTGAGRTQEGAALTVLDLQTFEVTSEPTWEGATICLDHASRHV